MYCFNGWLAIVSEFRIVLRYGAGVGVFFMFIILSYVVLVFMASVRSTKGLLPNWLHWRAMYFLWLLYYNDGTCELIRMQFWSQYFLQGMEAIKQEYMVVMDIPTSHLSLIKWRCSIGCPSLLLLFDSFFTAIPTVVLVRCYYTPQTVSGGWWSVTGL